MDILLAAVGLVWCAALLAPLVRRRLGQAAGWVLSIPPGAVFLAALATLGRVSGGETLLWEAPWVPTFGVSLAFLLDGLSLLFVLLVSGIGALVVLYGSRYLEDHDHEARFYAFTLLFMGAMLALVLSGNLLVLFLSWEATSVSSYLLIGFDHGKPAARRAALQALLVTALGGLALLAGFVMMGAAAGSYDLPAILASGDLLRAHPLFLPMLLLILAGAFTKSAQVPFHFWLPSAMEAPTPVSAYLHSATMVKAGVYLLARLSAVFGPSPEWHLIVTTTGALTMLTGALMALGQHDLKRILAYTTVSALGTLTMLLGLHTVEAVYAAAVFLLVHSLYKGALFLIAGSIDHETGTRDIRRLGGLRRTMPLTAAGMVLAALSMAGLPPLLGFISKELLYEAKLQAPALAPLITGLGVAANAVMVAVAATIAIRPFFGALRDPALAGHEPPFRLRLGPQVLALFGLLAGLWPPLIQETLINPVVRAVYAEQPQAPLALWHGFGPVLALSAATVAAGLGIFFLMPRLNSGFGLPAARIGPAAWYTGILEGTKSGAAILTRFLQSGYLRFYIMTVIGFAVVLIGYVLATRTDLGAIPPPEMPQAHELAIAALIAASAIAAVRLPSRLAAIVALGGVGLGVAVLFLLYGAPDLALTQFAIEMLTVMLFVLVLTRLPRFRLISSPASRRRDAVIAAAAGALMTLVLLAVTTVPAASPLREFVGAQSLVSAQGRNVVNVILVDFRGLDTLGEITVLALAALGVYALLKSRSGGGEGA